MQREHIRNSDLEKLFTFLNVNWFLTFSKSADCLHSYLNTEGINFFFKILVFVKILSNGEEETRKKFRSLEVREASSSHPKIELNFLPK